MVLVAMYHTYRILLIIRIEKNFCCFMSLPSFYEKRTLILWLPAYTSFHSIHVRKFAKKPGNQENEKDCDHE